LSSDDQELLEELMRMSNEAATMQRRLHKQNEALRRLTQRKDELLGTVAHDLRTPLGNVAGYAQLLERRVGDQLDPTSRSMLGHIQSSARFMKMLVEDLLDLSAIESGHVRVEPEVCELRDVLEQGAAIVRPAAEHKQIALHLCAEVVEVFADRPRMHQVVANLVDNAVKYAPRHSEVHIVGYRDGDGARFEVRDQGQGIPLDEQAGLFRPFATTSARATEGEPSTGLGLAIARKVVQSHGGRIGVTSDLGEGSTFWVWLPSPPSVASETG
jgi:signal transduction histidine kinase